MFNIGCLTFVEIIISTLSKHDSVMTTRQQIIIKTLEMDSINIHLIIISLFQL